MSSFIETFGSVSLGQRSEKNLTYKNKTKDIADKRRTSKTMPIQQQCRGRRSLTASGRSSHILGVTGGLFENKKEELINGTTTIRDRSHKETR